MKTDLNFQALATSWRTHKKELVKRSSMAAYVLIIENHLIPYFESKSVFQPDSIQQFVNYELNRGLSLKSVKDMVVVLKMILRHAVSLGYDFNLNQQIIFPKEYGIKEIPVFSPWEQKILYDFLISNLTFKNLGLLICLNTGLRIGEICGLKWEDINIAQGVIKVNKTLYRVYEKSSSDYKTHLIVAPPKTKHSCRTIPVSDTLKAILTTFTPVADKENFLLTNKSYPIEPRTYRVYYKRILKKLKLRDLKFHGLRHSFATRCIESNCDYKTVSAILGHSDISTTLNLYVHPSDQQKKNCIEKMLKSLTST